MWHDEKGGPHKYGLVISYDETRLTGGTLKYPKERVLSMNGCPRSIQALPKFDGHTTMVGKCET